MANADANLFYLDANVFIQAVEGTTEAASPAKALIAALYAARPGLAVTSEYTLAEVLATPKRLDAAPLTIKRKAYLDLILWSGIFTMIPVSRLILLDTADLRATTNLRLPDSIHAVSARHAGCRWLISDDKDFDKLPDGIGRLDCSADNLPLLLREFS